MDKQSLKEAKDSIKSVKTFAEGIKPSLDMTRMRKQMQEMERYAKRIRDLMRGRGGGNPPPHPPGGNPPPPPPPPVPPGRPPKPPKVDPAQRRADIAAMKMENFSFRAAQLPKADIATLTQANRIIAQTLDLYRQEKITLARVNQTMAHQLDNIRRSHRAANARIEDEVRGRRRIRREEEAIARARIRARERERKLREREEKRVRDQRARDNARRYDRVKESVLGLNPSMLAGALVGGALAAGIAQLRNVMSESARRTNMISRGAQNVQTNPNAVLAMESWGRVNGVDSANIIKAIDNIKDVRERLGNSAMNSTFDKKSGKWKGGDSGINDIMNQFGWNIDQLKQFQNRPLDFVQAVVSEGQRRGMNSAQIGRLMENLGDDLMHYQRMFLDGGKEFLAMVHQLKDTGGALNEEQITAAQNYVVMSEKLDQFSNGFSASMLQGFMDGMKDAPNFASNVKQLNEAAIGLGKALGDLTVGFLKMANWTLDFMKKYGPKDTSPEGIKTYYEGGDKTDPAMVQAMGGNNTGLLSWLFGTKTATDLPLGSYDPSFMTNPLTPNPYSVASNIPNITAGILTPQTRYPIPLNVQNTLTVPDKAFQVNIIPDGYGFSNYLDAQMNTQFQNFSRGLTLQLSSGQSSTGG